MDKHSNMRVLAADLPKYANNFYQNRNLNKANKLMWPILRI